MYGCDSPPDRRPACLARWTTGSTGTRSAALPAAVVEVAATLGRRRLGPRARRPRVRSANDVRRRSAVALAEVARPGKPGVVCARRGCWTMSTTRGVPAQSELEACAVRHARGRGTSRAATTTRASGGSEGLQGSSTLRTPIAASILEADGRRWGTRVADLRRDHERDAEAARVGWLTLRFLYEQITHDPDGVSAVVADVRRVRMAHPAPPAADGEAIVRDLAISRGNDVRGPQRSPQESRAARHSLASRPGSGSGTDLGSGRAGLAGEAERALAQDVEGSRWCLP